jgi:glycosyltransferase involved in cell wall biosynthesis
MHICIVSGTFPPMHCGVGDSTKVIARALARAGHQVTVLTSYSVDNPAGADGYKVVGGVTGWRLADVPQIIRLLRSIKPDAIVVQYPTKAYGRKLGIFLIPVSIRLARIVPRRRLLLILHEYLNAHWLKRLAIAAMVITVPQTLAFEDDLTRLRRWIPSAMADIHARPPSPVHFDDVTLTEEERKEFRAQMGAANGDFLLINFGLVSPAKGIESILQAHVALLKQGLSTTVVIVGPPAEGNDEYVAQLKQQSVELGIEKKVTWLGYQPEESVVKMLKAADVTVLPFVDGVRYPMSASFATAASCGVPIITTERSPSKSQNGLVTGNNAILVPPGDVPALTEAVKGLAANGDLRARIAKNAREVASSTHGTAATVQVILECLEGSRGA